MTRISMNLKSCVKTIRVKHTSLLSASTQTKSLIYGMQEIDSSCKQFCFANLVTNFTCQLWFFVVKITLFTNISYCLNIFDNFEQNNMIKYTTARKNRRNRASLSTQRHLKGFANYYP